MVPRAGGLARVVATVEDDKSKLCTLSNANGAHEGAVCVRRLMPPYSP